MGIVDEIKVRLDIVDVIGEYIPLTKAGRSYKAPCPFHTEKTPSFIVFPERQSWHCFGACGVGGDLIAFVMRKEVVDFREALRLLANRAGIALIAPREEGTGRRRLLEACAAAVQLYHRLLLDTAGGPARDYLASRGVDAATVQAFGLGYSPSGWDWLHRQLRSAGFTDDELLAAGLLVKGERGVYDRFRHRLMFPVTDSEGRVVGFGARALDKDAQPKYLNTPQTAIYDKSGILYALDRAKQHIVRQDSAVIVEGYMDAIAAHQHGFGNVVAAMGTALTARQVGLLRSLTENLLLALDADAAGQAAALRGIRMAIGDGGLPSHIRRVRLPQGSDPDDVIRSSPPTWQRLVNEAEPLFDEDLLPDQTERRPPDRPRPLAQPAPELHMIGAEEYCLALLLRYRELRDDGLTLDEGLFIDSANRHLLNVWRVAPGEDELREHLPIELHGHLNRILALPLPGFKPAEARAALADRLSALRRRRLAQSKEAASAALASVEQKIGPSQVAAATFAAWQEGRPVPAKEAAAAELHPDEALQAAELHLRDMELGLRLHRRPPDKGGQTEPAD